jgi:hypothetical protein
MGGGEIFAPRPTIRAPSAPIILTMQQTTSPVRRYVILRRRDHGSAATRWSMEKLAPQPRAAEPAPAAQVARAAQAAARP